MVAKVYRMDQPRSAKLVSGKLLFHFRHKMNNISYTPCRNTAISPVVGYLYPPPPPHCACANVILPYQTKKVQLNKLPQTTMIIFRIIVGTIRFNNAKIQTHALGSMCVRRDGI